MSRAVLLYDAGCRFCRFVARRVVALDRRERLAFLPFDDPEAAALLADLSPAARRASIHLVGTDGRRSSAGAALAELTGVLGLPRAGRLLGRVRPLARARRVLGRFVPDGPAPRRHP